MASKKKSEKILKTNTAENVDPISIITIGEEDGIVGLQDFLAKLSPNLQLAASYEQLPEGKKTIKIKLLKDDDNIVINKNETGNQIYKSLIDNSTSAIFLTKPDGQIIEVNNAAEKMFGYTKAEFVKLGRQGIIDDTDGNLNLFLTQRKQTGKAMGELTGIGKDKNKFPLEVTSAVFKDNFGEEFASTILQDISKRKKAQQEILLILNNTDESFILLDKQLLILNFNKQFKTLYQYYFNVQIKKGVHILEFVPPERINITKEIYEKVLQGQVVHAELPVTSINADENYFALKYAPSKDSEENLVGVLVTIRDITQQKNVQTEIAKQQALLEQAEANYREIFEKANDAIFVHDLETGKLLDLNKKGCDLFGKTKEEILTAEPSIFTANTSGYVYDIPKDKLKKAAEGEPQLFEWMSRHSDGTFNWVEVSLQKATIAGSERILAYYRLINDRKNAEVQNELHKRDKEALINNTDDFIWSIDCDYKLIAANKAYLSMMCDVLTKPHKVGDVVLMDAFGEAINNKWKAYYQRALAGEKYSTEEEFINSKTKRLTYELISFNPIYKDEKVTGVACYSKNITELTENQMAVKATNAELDNIMASSLDMICTIAENHSIERVSAASEIILGYKPEELVGKNLFDFIYHEDADNTKNTAEEVMTGKIKTNFYNRYVRKDGSLVYLEWTAKWDKHSKKRYGIARDVTSKLEAENKLKTSEQRFRSLVQDGSDMIAILNDDGTYKYVSPTSFAILGFEQHEFIEKNAFDFIHPNDVAHVQDHFALLQTNKKVTIPHFRFKNKNGEWRWLETSLTNLMDEPSINGIVANSRDITERKSIEDELVISNQRYENVNNATSDAIWDYDFASDEIYIGKGYEKLFGHKVKNNKAKLIMWNEYLYQEDKQRVLDRLEVVIKDKNINNWAEEYRYVKADGSLAFVMNKGIVIRNENGRVIRMLGAMQDITRQKEEEQYLKLMNSVITSTNDAVLITEANQVNEPGLRIIYVNEAFCKMTGYTVDEVIGKTPIILQGPKTDKIELERIGEALRKWESCEATVINYKKNGEEFWINFTLTPIADEKGWYTHWISVERDVTERKNDELLKELLRKIRIIFNEPISINETLDKVLKDVTLFGGFCMAESWLLSANKKEIKRVTYYVADECMRNTLMESTKFSVQKIGEGLVGTAWLTQALQTWDINKRIENILEEDVLINAGVKKLYALPFLNNLEIIGVLVFGLDKPKPAVAKFENLFNSIKIYLGAEIKRKQLEQELNQIFNFAPDIIAIIGIDGYFKKLNPAACELLEYSLEELMSRPFKDFIHPEDVNKTEEEFILRNKDSNTSYFENRYITKSGKIRWLAWTSTRSLEEEIIFSVAKNITEKKELEVVLEKANNLARIGSWELNIEENTIYWSEMTKEIHETSPEYEPILAFATDAYKEGSNRDMIVSMMNNAIQYNLPWDVELKIITQKNNEKWVRSIGKAEFFNGKCIKIYGSIQDIDERKRAIEKIRSSEERRELIMNSALDAIICIDKLGFVTFWNPQAELIFGWSEKEVMGKFLTDLIMPEQYKILKQNGEDNYFKTNKGQALNVPSQFSALRKNGKEFPIELTVLPIEQDGDEFFCAFVRDITERKLSETRLLELNQDLQKQTNELAGINKDLEQFAYVASHDLQEPLRMVSSFITKLEKRYENVLDEKGKKYIYFAVDGARRMRLIILDLLEYSKIGRIDELKENVDLNEIVEEIKILYASKIEERQAYFISNNLPIIPSYKSPIKQIFQNIIGNALKYSKDDNPCRVIISAEDMGTLWHFSITDNGIGINKDYFDKIFIIFQRLHTNESYSGTGMGLALTKKFIENLHGKIWVESIEGEGSIFHFTLPKI